MPQEFRADDYLSATHEVLNQPAPLEHYNAYASDRVLQHWVTEFGGQWGSNRLNNYGALVGGDLLTAGFAANKHKPEFHSHDRFGHRVDLVEFHPAYHQLMTAAIKAGHHSLPHTHAAVGANVVRAGFVYLHAQADPGSGCPLTMTHASVPALRHEPKLAAQWLPKILSNSYDPANVPHFEKTGLTIGMAMTEKQGGSDVRANSTVAKPLGEDEGVPTYAIVGHKWFCSAPMCDAFLTLAYTDEGMGCFLVPRWRPDGSKNPMQIQRLKNKVGNISNASSEVEFRGAFAWRVGAAGKGVRTILEMVAVTRFDCMVASSAMMAQGAKEAIFHSGQREAFGKNLHQQPLMANVLADLALEAEAATAISMRMGEALDLQASNDSEALLLRLGTAIGKYWICKRLPQHSYESMESIGAVGLIEDNVAARLYKEAPVNAIWEGSGNIQCLDVMRTINKEPDTLDVFYTELSHAKGMDNRYDTYLDSLMANINNSHNREYRLRSLVEQLALSWQAATLLMHGEPFIAEAFIASRLSAGGHMYGNLPVGVNCDEIIARAAPAL